MPNALVKAKHKQKLKQMVNGPGKEESILRKWMENKKIVQFRKNKLHDVNSVNKTLSNLGIVIQRGQVVFKRLERESRMLAMNGSQEQLLHSQKATLSIHEENIVMI